MSYGGQVEPVRWIRGRLEILDQRLLPYREKYLVCRTVDQVVDAKGTRKVAQAYLEFLYTPKAQAIIARHFYRPVKTEAAAKEDLERLPKLRLITIDDVFGGWAKAQKTHFDDGGVFDAIIKANR